MAESELEPIKRSACWTNSERREKRDGGKGEGNEEREKEEEERKREREWRKMWEREKIEIGRAPEKVYQGR